MSETTDDILEDGVDPNPNPVDVLELSDEDFSKVILPETSTVGIANETPTDQSEDSSTQTLEIQKKTEIDSGTESTESGTQGNSDTGTASTDTVSVEGTQKNPEKETMEKTVTGETQSINVPAVDYEADIS